MKKDVHTEHCCVYHGCKYGDEDCTVVTKLAPQSYPCEDCRTPEQIVTKIYHLLKGQGYEVSRDAIREIMPEKKGFYDVRRSMFQTNPQK